LKPEWWGSPWLKRRSTREERKPVTRDDDDDDDDNNNKLKHCNLTTNNCNLYDNEQILK
jgi:hypothetical protein